MTESIRLAKHLAELVACSRTEAEQYIQGGWVTVDGEIVEEAGFRVLPQHHVALLPDAVLQPVDPVTILLHLPVGIDLASDPADLSPILQFLKPANLAPEDRSGLRFLKHHLVGLTVVNQIEVKASGLVVLTQDWKITRKLVDDAAKIEQEYIVEVQGDIIPYGLQLLSHGLKFSGKPLPPVKVSWQNETRLRFPLKAPPRGLIAHMCEKVGLEVVAMKRIRIGRVPMAGLPAGQWRYLLGYERF
ncbi:rRNA pseudouridine synthase [Glaciimonas immobilis]|uniref:Dual-specificity RNA pseudouridine synthase RluF n=1 Tax=Glaciimonas immobilis TaxID=728004 RepID=A0A840RXJ2_9BURK|nr:rRNA pseudouridine synthase [Glaciimonas immobilis]KAF3995926.1 RNA-binding protein [Glaciimonas immobilis]MBB5202625.1 23S rRNA pseudouridine2604 synthase [Glaciimonas immobilis]